MYKCSYTCFISLCLYGLSCWQGRYHGPQSGVKPYCTLTFPDRPKFLCGPVYIPERPVPFTARADSSRGTAPRLPCWQFRCEYVDDQDLYTTVITTYIPARQVGDGPWTPWYADYYHPAV